MDSKSFLKTAPSLAASHKALTKNNIRVEPEFIPLPAIGGDAIFGMSRSFWYSVEKAGLLTLIRFRRPGCITGRCMLPVPQAREALEKMSSGKHQSIQGCAKKAA